MPSRGGEVVQAPEQRRDEFVLPYFQKAQPDQVVVIIKGREPASILTAVGDKKVNKWHLEIKPRWVEQYNLDRRLAAERLHQLDQLYQAVSSALDNLIAALGLKLAA